MALSGCQSLARVIDSLDEGRMEKNQNGGCCGHSKNMTRGLAEWLKWYSSCLLEALSSTPVLPKN
jgi:hypothetical protein